MTAPFTPESCSGACTVVATGSLETSAVIKSPVNGTIVSWRIREASSSFKYKLRVLAPGTGVDFTGAGTSAAVSPVGFGLETFPTALPIKVGQLIGIDLEPDALIGFTEAAGTYGFYEPPLGDGATLKSNPQVGEIALNAVIQPAPTIGAISPPSGSFKGGTQVTITGTDLEGATAVTFGGSPAKSFTVNSETQITATAPATSKPKKLAIAVTTVAGAASSATSFASAACVVPKLAARG